MGPGALGAPSCLFWGTVEDVDLPGLVDVAAAAGYGAISVSPAAYAEARRLGASDHELRARLDDAGVAAAIVEPLVRGLPGSPSPEAVWRRFRPVFEHDEQDCYRVAAAVGATAVSLVHFLCAPATQPELVDAIGAIAERAGREGLDVLVEPIPEGSIPDLATGAAVVGAVGAPNCRLVLDAWHLSRAASAVGEVRALPADRVGAVQLSDAGTDLWGSGTAPPTIDRLLPGDGALPLAELVAAAIANNPAAVVGVEVFSLSLGALAPQERAARGKAGLDAVLVATERLL